jgi:hypothetical protein
MTLTIDLLLLVVAVVLLVAAAFGLGAGRVALGWLGLAAFVLTFITP